MGGYSEMLPRTSYGRGLVVVAHDRHSYCLAQHIFPGAGLGQAEYRSWKGFEKIKHVLRCSLSTGKCGTV